MEPHQPRRHRSGEEKSELVLLVLGGKSIAEIGQKHDVPLSVLYRWRAEFVAGGARHLASTHEQELSERKEVDRLRSENHDLERELGHQTMELARLRHAGERG